MEDEPVVAHVRVVADGDIVNTGKHCSGVCRSSHKTSTHNRCQRFQQDVVVLVQLQCVSAWVTSWVNCPAPAHVDVHAVARQIVGRWSLAVVTCHGHPVGYLAVWIRRRWHVAWSNNSPRG